MKTIRFRNKSAQLARRAYALLTRKPTTSCRSHVFSKSLLLAAGTTLAAFTALPLSVRAETTLPEITGPQSAPRIVNADDAVTSGGGTILNVNNVTMGSGDAGRLTAAGTHASLISLAGNNGSGPGGMTLLPSQYYGNITLNVTDSTFYGTSATTVIEGLYAKTMSVHDGSDVAAIPVTTVNVSGGLIDVKNTLTGSRYLNAILAEAQISAIDSTAGKLAGNVVVNITNGAKIRTSNTASDAPLNTGGAIHASGYNSTVTTALGTSIEVNGAGLTGIIASASKTATVNNGSMITATGANATGILASASVVNVTNTNIISAVRGIQAVGTTSAFVINSGPIETSSTAINVHSNGIATADNSGAIFTSGAAASGMAVISGGGKASIVVNRQFGVIESGGFGIFSIASLGTKESSLISNEILAPGIYTGTEGAFVFNSGIITSGKAAIAARTTGGLIDSALAAGDVTVNVGGDTVVTNTGNLKTSISTSGSAEPTPHGIAAIVRGVEIDATGTVTGNVVSNVTGNITVSHSGGTIETTAAKANGIYALIEGTVNRGSGNVTGTIADNVTGDIRIGVVSGNVLTPITGTIKATGDQASGIYARNTGTGSIVVNSAADIMVGAATNTNSISYGIGAYSESGDSTIYAAGHVANNNATGANHHGIIARASGVNALGKNAKASVIFDDVTGTVTTNGAGAMAIGAASGSDVADVLVHIKAIDTITTNGLGTSGGLGSSGIYAATISGDVAVQVDSANLIQTKGTSAFGIYAFISDSTSTGNISVVSHATAIKVEGTGAHGINAYNSGLGSVFVEASGDITADLDHGISAVGKGITSDVTVNYTSGTITTGYSGLKAAIAAWNNAEADSYGRVTTVTTAAGTVLNAARGIAAHTRGTVATGASTTVNNGATINATYWGIDARNVLTPVVSVLNDAPVTVNNTGGITMTGAAGSIAIRAEAQAGTIRITNTGTLTTTGAGLGNYGIYATVTDTTAAGKILIGVAADNTALPITGTISTAGEQSHGIQTISNGTGVTIINSAADITTTGDDARAINAAATGTGGIAIKASGGTITTTNGAGVFAQTVDGDIAIDTTGATLDVTSTNVASASHANGGTGVFGYATGNGNVDITVGAGSITLENGSDDALIGISKGTGTVSIANAATIVHNGTRSDHFGIVAATGYLTTANGGAITFNNTGNIRTDGGSTIAATTNNAGGNLTITNSGTLSTTGVGARGISAQIGSGANAALSTGAIAIDNTGAITTTDGHGIYALNYGTGTTSITNDGAIIAGGISATYRSGICSDTATGLTVVQNSGFIQSGTDYDAIHLASKSGKIQVINSGELSADDTAMYVYSTASGAGADIRINNTGNLTVAGTYGGGGVIEANSGAGRLDIVNQGGKLENSSADHTTTAGIYAATSTGVIAVTSTDAIITGPGKGISASSAAGGNIHIGQIANFDSSGNFLGTYMAAPVSGTITTTGSSSHGIYASAANAGNITIASIADITATGASAYGIYADGITGNVSLGYNADGSTNAIKGNLSSTSHAIFGRQTGVASSGSAVNILYNDATGVIGTVGGTNAAYAIYANTNVVGNAADAIVTVKNVGLITGTGTSATGITAFSRDGDAIVNFEAGKIKITGFNGDGIYTYAYGTGNSVVNAAGEIEALGEGTNTQSIVAHHLGTGDILVTYTGTHLKAGIATTTGGNAINAGHAGAASGDVLIKVTNPNALIETEGDNVRGIRGYTSVATSAGNVTIGTATEAIQGAITTAGSASHAISGYTTGGTGAVAINNAATIKTAGTGAYGIHAQTTNATAGSATVANRGNITTTGSNAHALYVTSTGVADTTAYSSVAGTTSTLITTGSGAYGISASGTGSRIVSTAEKTVIHTAAVIDADGNVLEGQTSGAANAHGIYATKGAALAFTNVDVTTHGDNASSTNAMNHGVHAEYDSRIDLTNAVVTTNGTRSIGLLAADYSNLGTGGIITQTGGSVTTNGSRASALLARNGGVIDLTNVNVKAAGSETTAIEVSNVNNPTASSTVMITGGSVDSGDNHLIYANAGANVTLKDVGSVNNGDYVLRAINDGTASYTVNLALDNTTITGDVAVGTEASFMGEFTADDSLWSCAPAAGKSTLNIDLTNGAVFHLLRASDDAYEFCHNITADSSSTLIISLADTVSTFASGTPNSVCIGMDAAGMMSSSFSGTVVLGKGTFDLECALAGTQAATNVSALAAAQTLRLDAGNFTNVTGVVNDGTTLVYGSNNKVTNAGGAAFNELEFNGGALVFNSPIPGSLRSDDFLTVGTITADTGTVRVDMGWATPVTPSAPNTLPLLDQQKIDDNYDFVQLAAAASVTAGVGAVELRNIDGTAVNIPDSTGTLIEQGGVTVATADYGYALGSTLDNVSHDGIYVGYRLKTLHILDGKTLIIDNAGTFNTVLDTLVLSDGENGTGVLAIADTAGSGITVNNASNDTGAIVLTDGTLIIGTNEGLGTTGDLIITDGTTLDVNGRTQTLGGLETQAGSTVDFANGTLNVTGDAVIGNVIVVDDTVHLSVEGTTLIDAGTTAGVNGELHVKNPDGIHFNDVVVGNGDLSNGGGIVYVYDDVPLNFGGSTTVNKDGKIIAIPQTGVNPGDKGGDITIVGDGPTIVDGGQIIAGDGADNSSGPGGNGGAINIPGPTTVINDGEIISGNGGNGTTGGNGGDINTSGGPTTVDTGGSIIAGDGGNGTAGDGGNGGDVNIPGDGPTTVDDGVISGGNGGTGTDNGGNGGTVDIEGPVVIGDGDTTDGSGAINGGNGGDGETGNGGNGGGVILDGDTTVNDDGTINGGQGGNGGTTDGTGNGGNGGTVDIGGDTTVDGGEIHGGDGGNGGATDGNGGNGGNVDIGGGTTIDNDGIISGGNGGHGGGNDDTDGSGTGTGNGGNGGSVIIDGPVTVGDGDTGNGGGTIDGGNGGNGGNGGGNGGNGGGIVIDGVPVVVNEDGTINGGDGGNGHGTGDGGNGGGIDIGGDTTVDGGSINGGDGGDAEDGNGGNGGEVDIDGSVVVDNGGSINGGDGGNSNNGQGGNGGNVIIDGDVTLDNGGTINPGQGGTGGAGNGTDGSVINNGLIVINDPVLHPQPPQVVVHINGGDFYNNGTILFPETNFSGRTNGTEATLDIAGNYHGGDMNGNGKGQIVLNAWELGPDRNVVDQVHIGGNADGQTDVTIIKYAGNGAPTAGEGILVISVGGISTADAFTLVNEVTAGFYSYGLFHGDTNSNWYLRSTGVNSAGGAVLTGAAGSSIGWFAQGDNLLKRMGDIRLSDGAAANGTFWTRAYGQQNNISLGAGIPDSRLYTYGADIGSDIAFAMDDSLLATGAFVGYSGNRNDVRDHRGSTSKSNGLQAGVYATWSHNSGLYADIVAKGQYADNEFHSYGAQTDKGSYDSYGAGVSLELGWQFESLKGWFVEPSAQVAYMHQFNDTYSTDNDLRVQMQDADICQFSGMVRFGKTIDAGESLVQPYGKFGVVQQTTSGGHVRALDGRWRPTVDGTSAVIGAGVNFQVSAATQIHLDYEASFSEKNDKPWGINLGVTTRF